MSDDKRKLDPTHMLYGHTDNVLWFNRHGHGPFSADVCVRANVHPSTSYPDARISFGQYGGEPKEMDFGGVILTVKQAAEVVKQLKAAIADVVKACPSLALAAVEVEDLS